LPDIAINDGRKWRKKNLGWTERIEGGNRAEVRRERKKRDIPSPVNVSKTIYQKALYKSILF